MRSASRASRFVKHVVRGRDLRTDGSLLASLALAHERPSGRKQSREYVRSLRHVDTEAVHSLSDPLPGLYKTTLLAYLAMKCGL